MTKQRNNRIPDFKSRTEMAKFWDTHDVSDYWDELKPVRVKVANNLSQGLTIRLDSNTLNSLRLKAQKKGIGPTTLARMWIMENVYAA